MANKFITLLQHLGQDMEHGLEKAVPFLQTVSKVAEMAFPGFASLIATGMNVVISVEQKWQAAGKASGNGQLKLADAVNILGPIIQQYVPNADKDTTTQWVNTFVALLNLIPAPKA